MNHLSRDVERFWFQGVIAGNQTVTDDVLEGYRRNIERGDEIITTGSLDGEPAWWPESLFGSWRLDSVREIVLHVITETAAHVGHLDAARELIDGEQRLVLTG